MPNDDATLKSLTSTPGTVVPGLWGTRTNFAVVLPHSERSIRITAPPCDPAATLRVAGRVTPHDQPSEPIELPIGRTTLEVEVLAADGTTRKVHSIKVTRQAPTPDWERLVEAAPFAARDSAGEMVFNDRMWLLGGYLPHLVADVWSSGNGTTWNHTGDVPDEGGINIPATFAHAGRMWVTGQSGKLFASADGKTWDIVSAAPPWSGRYAVGAAVFQGRMWVLGGSKDGVLYNDVWSSADGVEWKLEAEHAGWSPRQLFSNVVVHRGKLWVIGGGVTSYQPFRAYRDVWCSDDGRSWTKVADEAPWSARIWSSCVVYRDRLWLLSGFRSQPAWENFRDAWHSPDGVTWTRLETEHMWEARHEVCAYVFHDSLWVVAGNAWPLVNDVWRLHIPGLTFTSQPIVEEYVNAQYTYRARADFHASGRPLRYRLVTAPAWLTIEADTGVVRGISPAIGEFPVTIEADDGAGETARQEYALHVITL
ncbi:MAG: cadherin-like beta sandwich domain-containing protein [Planctomycetes bacterium]|nr:cadherin-like beta sandwich domain-containing protein [Planctomycetota bacterium]